MINTFAQAISPLEVEEFLICVWDRDFFHGEGEAQRYEHLFPWHALNDALTLQRHAPPRIKMVKAGKLLDPWTYLIKEMGTGRVRAEEVRKYLRDGATLILNCVEEIYSPLADLVKSFEETLRIRVNVNLYAGWKAACGFDTHFDVQENLVLQLYGRKRWRVWRPTRDSPLKPDVVEASKPTDQPVWDGVLESGSFIYIPRGWWHVAEPMNEPCMHLTFTINANTGHDFLAWIVKRSRQSPVVRRTLPLAWNHKLQCDYLTELRTTLGEYLTDETLAEFLNAPPNPLLSDFSLPDISENVEDTGRGGLGCGDRTIT
jgi:Cupin superfamily protein